MVYLIFLPLITSLISLVKIRALLPQKLMLIIMPLIGAYLSLKIDVNHSFMHHIFGIKYEPIGRSFAIFLNIMWLMTNLYAIGYKKQKEYTTNQFKKLTSLISLSVFWAQIAAIATNSVIIVFCYEMLTITTFFLVNFDKTPESFRGARKYFKILMASSIGMLVPFIILLNVSLENADFAKLVANNYKSFVLLLLVFGASKNAIFPLSSWLNAAMVAPIPVSGLLHAVAVVNTGIIIVLKFYVYIIGFSLPHDVLGDVIKIAAIITIFLPAIQTLRTDDIKSILAYSTISQLGIVMFGMLTLPKDKFLAEIVICQLFAHGMAKIILFFSAGEFYYLRKTYNLNDYHNMIKQNPIIVAIFIIAALSIVGMPPFIGFYTKSAMIMSEVNHVNQLILIASSGASLLYFIKIFGKIGSFKSEDFKYDKVKVLSFTRLSIVSCFILLISVSYFSKEIVVFLWNK
ncbi:MAG: hypothetical protein J0G32_00615 [Alphaproteobacteria bacterium]|nr:hypothetical protein [Alphaproteobacteria bacterium]OJV14254.1 MAG: hypothetical protein BGO27_02000 [Alphaproteobacteria bacterium 33-17]